jgi:pimeloyl-ACP methyl ester carboxylesterase
MARTRISMRATNYKSIDVDGLSIFYRESGSPDAPNLLLLHGFPSSSLMYEPLFPRLADAFHLVVPDYPGFGHSQADSCKRLGKLQRPCATTKTAQQGGLIAVCARPRLVGGSPSLVDLPNSADSLARPSRSG